MAAPYVQVRTKRRLRCPDQPDPRTDPNPLGGLRSALEVSRGSTKFKCKSENLSRTYAQLNAWSVYLRLLFQKQQRAVSGS